MLNRMCFPEGPLSAPLNLRVSNIQSTEVTVHWDPVTRNSLMGELKEYKVLLNLTSLLKKSTAVTDQLLKSKDLPSK